MSFRRIRLSDKAEFLQMTADFYASGAVLHPVSPSHHKAAFEELMQRDTYARCYIMEQDGVVVGYALLARTFSQEAGGMVTWVEELYLKPPYRGRGIASAFFAFLEQAEPSARFRLEVEPDNERAKALYRRRGYTILPYEQMIKEK